MTRQLGKSEESLHTDPKLLRDSKLNPFVCAFPCRNFGGVTHSIDSCEPSSLLTIFQTSEASASSFNRESSALAYNYTFRCGKVAEYACGCITDWCILGEGTISGRDTLATLEECVSISGLRANSMCQSPRVWVHELELETQQIPSTASINDACSCHDQYTIGLLYRRNG